MREADRPLRLHPQPSSRLPRVLPWCAFLLLLLPGLHRFSTPMTPPPGTALPRARRSSATATQIGQAGGRFPRGDQRPPLLDVVGPPGERALRISQPPQVFLLHCVPFRRRYQPPGDSQPPRKRSRARQSRNTLSCSWCLCRARRARPYSARASAHSRHAAESQSRPLLPASPAQAKPHARRSPLLHDSRQRKWTRGRKRGLPSAKPAAWSAPRRVDASERPSMLHSGLQHHHLPGALLRNVRAWSRPARQLCAAAGAKRTEPGAQPRLEASRRPREAREMLHSIRLCPDGTASSGCGKRPSAKQEFAGIRSSARRAAHAQSGTMCVEAVALLRAFGFVPAQDER
mmetsp:Transcript_4902/g.12197  ORF Transcript_4902/g.12197 Transcript_4902/m.12197 type:complete len:345 (-) Transcript_4902:2859-3893(-)